MTLPAIQVEGVSKRFEIGSREPYHRFSELLSNLGRRTVTAPRDWFRSAFKGSSPGVNGHAQETSNDFWALKDISLEVNEGEVLGIIGHNGAGKSTLLKILSRITEPTSGRFGLRGRVASLLEVGTGFHPELTGRDNVYLNGAVLGMTRPEIRRKFDEIVAFAEIDQFLDTPVKRYSSGMYMRLAFAVAAHLDSDILLVDEVLAVGDGQFQKKCLGKMQDMTSRQGRTILFVTHNLDAVKSLCHRALVLKRGLISFLGEANQAVENYSQLARRAPTSDIDFSVLQSQRFGEQRFATLRGAKLLDAHDQPASVLQMGSKATFLLSLDIRRPHDDFEIGIGITSLQDVAVHYLVSGWEGMRAIREVGPCVIRIELPQVHLFPGQYQAFFWIAVRGEYYDDAVHSALQFCVEEGPVNEHATYFSRVSRNTQVYVPSTWQLIESNGHR